MMTIENATPREKLLEGVRALHAQAAVIESTDDQQEFEEALADIEAAVQQLRSIK